jgi:predicted RNA-binding Zn-ribbon protein involved in translation (DUF1610 family)
MKNQKIGAVDDMSIYSKCPNCGGNAIYGDMGYRCMKCKKVFLPFDGKKVYLKDDKKKDWSRG